jgi:hypothetical protein
MPSQAPAFFGITAGAIDFEMVTEWVVLPMSSGIKLLTATRRCEWMKHGRKRV